jgi:hypothetical protein
LVVALLAAATSGQVVAKPEPGEFAQYVPANWQLVSTVRGELTGDRFPDAALVLQQTDPARRIPNNGLGEPVLDTNPRRLIVLAGSKAGFRWIASSDRLLPPQGDADSSCLADPLEDGGVMIERRLLRVNLHFP